MDCHDIGRDISQKFDVSINFVYDKISAFPSASACYCGGVLLPSCLLLPFCVCLSACLSQLCVLLGVASGLPLT